MARTVLTGRRRLAALLTGLAVAAGITAAAPALAAPAPPARGAAAPGPAGPAPANAAAALAIGASAPLAKPAAHPAATGGAVLVMLASGTTVTGGTLSTGRSPAARAPATSDPATNAALVKVAARSIRPLLPALPAPDASALAGAARDQLGADALDPTRLEIVDVGTSDPVAAARTLAGATGVAYAEPDRTVDSMATPPSPLPAWAAGAPVPAHPGPPAAGTAALPGNYGLTSSLLSYLNAGGVDAMGAYRLIGDRYHQLPGTGEIITNVSVGDLTDQSMADAGDAYVRANGPTTIVQDGQRYLDLPSMPLIPTYVAGPDGSLDPTGSTEDQDSSLGEVMLDFGVMAPLPHDQQRAGRTGDGDTDLLGIAPGAQYRLVVPQQDTFDQIGTALIAAANQTPHPNVITASLGFGTDDQGFPGRYLEDDRVLQSIIAGIVRDKHIVVCVAANDGTRLYTPASVGPDGGSTPTDLAKGATKPTNVDDDAYSTTPSEVRDSGAIAAGGTTLDDTLATPASSRSGTVVETRISGAGNFSSGFGTRVNLSAPSDGIVTFEHTGGGAADAVTPVISGGTSASAPEIAAAAAVVLQAARLSGRSMSPTDVRALLERTGRAVPTPAAIDRTLPVGPQIDVTRAVASLLPAPAKPAVVRVSVAHRATIGLLGGEFLEATDPGTLDLAGPNGTGEGLTGPVTFGLDAVGLPASGPLSYVLRVGTKEFTASQPAIRVLPADLLAAAGLPVVSSTDRTLAYTLEVRRGGQVLARAGGSLTVGPSDGGYAEASAPVAPATAEVGAPVTVHYDLTGVRGLVSPQLAVSTVGHPNPATSPLFTAGYTVDLTATKGTVTIPASAFHGGAGLYGIGVVQNSRNLPTPIYGEFTPIGLTGSGSGRPAAPTLSAGPKAAFGHQLTVTRAAPDFSLRYDVGGVPQATGAVLEISAPAPTIYGSLNTFTNANGSTRDSDGVNAGSVLYQPLSGRSGTLRRDALKLGIATSMSYNVRVLATDRHGAVIGQASPSSQLTIDDGLAPGGRTVDSFGIAGKDSVVAVYGTDGASVLRYDPATGTYGATLAHDADPAGGYEVFGVDPGAHRAVVMHWSTAPADQQVQTYDTGSGRLVASVTVPGSQYQLLGGRVDPDRHRAALLARHQPDGADTVLPVNVTTGALGTAIPADAPGVNPGDYSAIDIDEATGVVDLAHLAGGVTCFRALVGNVAEVDLDTGAVTASTSVASCAYQFASDTAAGKVYQLNYRSFSINTLGTTNLVPVATDTLSPGDTLTVRTQSGLDGLAIDGTHQLALVPFGTPAPRAVFGVPGGLLTDSNSTSQLAVVDLTTGATTEVLTGLNLVSGFGGPHDADTERSIQLDPATRTGWTYGPGHAQIEQFPY